ncbi:hypothetical protein NKR23_g6313 [Pleurostoma richardsiae]|uniref:Uncharacterized protein n=1 Tax=Pleurostoma richardsiae TaxID=41990 RepID=A0AA38VPD8_9PEZI|nr:hypothetical protein NKR23_g6313 [Pleurostoma richardsiae]
MSLGAVTTSAFYSCQPYGNATFCPATATATVTQTVAFTTEYYVTFLAACPTASWWATYTIEETCTGNPATWTPPVIPPSFTTTEVVCDVCAEKTQTITCPAVTASATATTPATVTVHGNGVTVTITPAPTTVATVTGGGATGAGACSTCGEETSTATSTGTVPVVTAGAPAVGTMKKGLALFAGAAVLAAQFML